MPSLKTTWDFIKKHPKKCIFLPLLFYVFMVMITGMYSSTGEVRNDCEEPTRVLDGGVHSFAGQDYKFTLCGNFATNRFSDNVNTIRLQVHDANNELLVERFFEVDLGGSLDKLEYTQSSVTYFDESENGDFKNVIPMPPRRWQWLKIQIKHSFWRGMEYVFIKPVENALF